MANFSSFNSLGFPSPIVTRNPRNNLRPVNSGFTNISHISGTPTSCTLSACSTAIQFPSPVYATSTSTLNMKAEYPKPRISLLRRSLELQPERPSPEFCHFGNDSTVPNIGIGWQCNVPSTMPWALSSYRQSLMQFTAANPSCETSPLSRIAPVHNIHTRRLKRRVAHSTTDDRPDNKVFINEDRVAESMRNLQLSGNTGSVIDRDQAWYTTRVLSEDDTGEMEQEEPVCTSSPVLKLSHELEAGLTKKDLVHQLIQEELNKSCKQIVLWTPPGGGIRELLGGARTSDSAVKRSMDVIDMGFQSPKKASKLPVNSQHVNHLSSGRSNSPLSQPIRQQTCQSPASMETSMAPTNEIEAGTSRMNLPQNEFNSTQVTQTSSEGISDSFSFFSNNNNVQSQSSVINMEQRTQCPPSQQNTAIPVYSRQTLNVASPEQSSCLDLMDDEDLDL